MRIHCERVLEQQVLLSKAGVLQVRSAMRPLFASDRMHIVLS